MPAAPRTPPVVSFGLPVRNGAATITEAIESVQAQTFDDWELVISDNLSSDGTTAICSAFAARDKRIRHFPTGRDLSQNENFCEAFRRTRGTYFRWYGDDDWLEPEFAERAVAALDAAPTSVLCTTVQAYYRDGEPLPINDPIPRLGGVDQPDPAGRLRALLGLFEHGGHLGIDPVYSLARRDAVDRTTLMSAYRFGDFIYSCEMALQGPFVHVPEVLAHRRLPTAIPDEFRRFTDRGGWTRYVQREISLLKVWHAAREAEAPRRSLIRPLVGMAVREHAHGLRRRAAGVARPRRGRRTVG